MFTLHCGGSTQFQSLSGINLVAMADSGSVFGQSKQAHKGFETHGKIAFLAKQKWKIF